MQTKEYGQKVEIPTDDESIVEYNEQRLLDSMVRQLIHEGCFRFKEEKRDGETIITLKIDAVPHEVDPPAIAERMMILRDGESVSIADDMRARRDG